MHSPDLAGVPQSLATPSVAVDVDALVEDVKTLVDAHPVLRRGRFVLVGHSMGGRVAINFTLGHLVRIIFSTQNSHAPKSGHIYVALVRLNEEGREATFPPSLAPSDIAVVFAVLRRSGNC
jgi:pimeloyl-ACP methyl ester carboxylesterase